MLLRFVSRVLLVFSSGRAAAGRLFVHGHQRLHRPVRPPSRLSQLPAEARQTVALIDQGGPFPYAKDGVVFGNYEKLLPQQKRGYYHEYTVKTPGSRDRGARRIVTGQGGEIYYTDDHYKSFRTVLR
jgi:ribonuclease T1